MTHPPTTTLPASKSFSNCGVKAGIPQRIVATGACPHLGHLEGLRFRLSTLERQEAGIRLNLTS